MIFNSVAYALFFPIIAILYLSLPKRAGNLCLLIAGYLFYMTAVPAHALLLLAVSLTAYFSAVLMDKKNQKKDRKGILIIALIIELGLLFFFKYFGFACEIAGVRSGLD
ncbi:MAG: MBOAT family protein, partial [Lachnospiraceae bacterium]|nr:MBOAT family protein [Lachnospiraceae bacterium]